MIAFACGQGDFGHAVAGTDPLRAEELHHVVFPAVGLDHALGATAQRQYRVRREHVAPTRGQAGQRQVVHGMPDRDGEDPAARQLGGDPVQEFQQQLRHRREQGVELLLAGQ